MTDPHWKPCPFCGAEMEFEIEGMEHPASDTCPLDQLYVLEERRDDWNMRVAPEAMP